jgi:hypothetical protein
MPLKRAVPIAVAVAVLVLGLCIGGFLGPYYGKSRLDPNYQYLLNGLAVLKGQVPGHTDHPGTPVQELGAVAILLKWLITDRLPIASAATRELSHRNQFGAAEPRRRIYRAGCGVHY